MLCVSCAIFSRGTSRPYTLIYLLILISLSECAIAHSQATFAGSSCHFDIFIPIDRIFCMELSIIRFLPLLRRSSKLFFFFYLSYIFFFTLIFAYYWRFSTDCYRVITNRSHDCKDSRSFSEQSNVSKIFSVGNQLWDMKTGNTWFYVTRTKNKGGKKKHGILKDPKKITYFF